MAQRGGEGGGVAGQQAVDQQQMGDRGGFVGVAGAPGDRKPVQRDGEQQHQQQAEPEARQRHAEQGRDAGGAVGEAAAVHAGQQAERDADGERQERGGQRELDGGGQAIGDHVEHRAAMEEAAAEIAVQRAPDEAGEPFRERKVESEVVAQRGDLFRRGALVAEHDLHRIARGRRGHGEDDQRGAEQHGDQVEDAVKQAGGHAVTTQYLSRCAGEVVAQRRVRVAPTRGTLTLAASRLDLSRSAGEVGSPPTFTSR